MGRENDQPFERGATWYNGGDIPNFLSPPIGYDGHPGGFNLEGKEYIFEDGSTGTQTEKPGYGTGFYVRVRCVRNNSGHNILPGQLCKFTTTYVDGTTVVPMGLCVGDITTVLADYCYPADEFLPPAGVAQGDLFYIVVDGPCLLKLTHAGTPTLVVGQKVVSQTAANNTDAEAGTIIGQVITDGGPITVTDMNQIQNAIGRAMSQASSHATDGHVLVDIGWE